MSSLSIETGPQQAAIQSSRRGLFAKRGLDVCTAFAALIVLLPLFVLIIVLVKASDGGPVFFGQKRLGYGRREFRCWKFRSMMVNSDDVLARHLAVNEAAADEWRRKRKLSNDPRVTPLGLFLRKSSLDELPQLFNVLTGEMSLVGPRPIVDVEAQRYGDYFNEYASVRPGITGLWQVSGRSNLAFEHRVKLDATYVRNWSLKNDILILARTIPAVLAQRGSC